MENENDNNKNPKGAQEIEIDLQTALGASFRPSLKPNSSIDNSHEIDTIALQVNRVSRFLISRTLQPVL
ncbi:hypothetical protein KKF38_01515 [Patescibacteria group bacterium]|nr:hypothetical protein [Patescibacteria group bacterium]